MATTMGYNRGDSYEQKIFDILNQRGLVPSNFSRAGASGETDLKFLYQGTTHNLEIKLDLRADYGQKMLKWRDCQWFWCKDDKVTQLYTSVGVLDLLNQKNLKPNRFVVNQDDITLVHKHQDQRAFEDKIPINVHALYDFYAVKNCYYIQVGNYGFYHLKDDVLSLGTDQFRCSLKLRLRAKTIHSKPPYKYGFYAVLKITDKPKTSKFDIEEKSSRLFPPI